MDWEDDAAKGLTEAVEAVAGDGSFVPIRSTVVEGNPALVPPRTGAPDSPTAAGTKVP